VGFIREEGTFDKFFRPFRPGQKSADPAYQTVSQVVRDASTEELEELLERGKRGAARNRLTLQGTERSLEMRACEDRRSDDPLALLELGYLKNKSPEELLALQQTAQAELKRYEEGLRIATPVLAGRRASQLILVPEKRTSEWLTHRCSVLVRVTPRQKRAHGLDDQGRPDLVADGLQRSPPRRPPPKK
jgi:hypothetical protein